MKLISCNNCATILDQDKLKFAEDIYDAENSIDPLLGDYCQETKAWAAFINCPVCKEKIFEP
jgi:hypothetical protein